MEEEHLMPICEDENSISTIDECENELLSLSTYLQLESEDDNYDDDQTFEWPDHVHHYLPQILRN